MTIKKNDLLKATWLCYFIISLNCFWIRGIQISTLVALVILTCICRSSVFRKKDFSTSLWYAVLLLYILMSFLWGKYPYSDSGVHEIAIRVAIYSICLDQFCNSKENVDFALNALLIAAVVYAIHIFAVTPVSAYGTTTFGDEVREQRNFIGQFCALNCTISVVLLFDKRKQKTRFLYIFAIVICYAIVCCSGSRKAVIMFPFSAFLFIFSNKPVKKTLRIVLYLSLCTVLIVFLYFKLPFLQDYYGRRMMALVDRHIRDGSITNRRLLAKYAKDIFLQYPVFGAGCDAVRNYLIFGSNALQNYAHNNYLEILADYGLVGFAIYYSRHITAVIAAIKNKCSDKYWKLIFTVVPTIMLMDYGQVSYQKGMYIYILVIVCAPIKWKTSRLQLKRQENEESEENG